MALSREKGLEGDDVSTFVGNTDDVDDNNDDGDDGGPTMTMGHIKRSATLRG